MPAARNMIDLISTPTAQTVSSAVPETTREQRSEVHRKLGRCLLRLQQYEMLTKDILVAHDQSGTIDDWEARHQARVDKFAKMTLGQLVEWMKTSYLTSDLDAKQREASNPPDGLNQIWFSFRGGMQMEPENYQRTVSAMEELVALRNDMVHHLLQKFNLWTLTGCAAADAHLEQSYELIDRHMIQLGDWARAMDKARKLTANLMASDEYLQLLRAELPGAPALNRDAPIVQRLCEAEAALAADGWVLLDDAIAFIRGLDRDEFPSKYNCKTWRQVLLRSGAFELEKKALPDRSGLFTAFRSLAPRPAA
jgi:hypothetical protein